ncbi:hypothetical protein HYQ46_003738 [Verticillium longisporum]|nr:hypothetical protein HYQ46_003738 [Verticillium longisporum]
MYSLVFRVYGSCSSRAEGPVPALEGTAADVSNAEVMCGAATGRGGSFGLGTMFSFWKKLKPSSTPMVSLEFEANMPYAAEHGRAAAAAAGGWAGVTNRLLLESSEPQEVGTSAVGSCRARRPVDRPSRSNRGSSSLRTRGGPLLTCRWSRVLVSV